MIYRGYNLKEENGKWIITKDNLFIASVLGSEEAAMNWIDKKKKEELNNKNN